MDITQAMVDRASAEEASLLDSDPIILQAQNAHLHQRVILLRALANQQAEEIEELRKIKKPQDRRPPAKKTAAKKAAAPRKKG